MHGGAPGLGVRAGGVDAGGCHTASPCAIPRHIPCTCRRGGLAWQQFPTRFGDRGHRGDPGGPGHRFIPGRVAGSTPAVASTLSGLRPQFNEGDVGASTVALSSNVPATRSSTSAVITAGPSPPKTSPLSFSIARFQRMYRRLPEGRARFVLVAAGHLRRRLRFLVAAFGAWPSAAADDRRFHLRLCHAGRRALFSARGARQQRGGDDRSACSARFS